MATTFNTFKPLNSTDIVNNTSGQLVTAPLWANNTGTLVTYYTSSLMTATQKQYYYDVVSDASTSASGQFAITYGNRLGSGSYSGGGSLNDSPTRAIYSQYKNYLLNPDDNFFNFKRGCLLPCTCLIAMYYFFMSTPSVTSNTPIKSLYLFYFLLNFFNCVFKMTHAMFCI